MRNLDFQPESGSLPLHPVAGVDLPTTAQRVAARGGVQVVFVRFTAAGRLTARRLSAVLNITRDLLLGEVFLVAADASAVEWQFVYPSYQGGHEVLRRMALLRGQPRRTLTEGLASIYTGAQQGDLRAALEAAYNVEAVTKRFFTQYRDVFGSVMGLVQGLPDSEERKLFCQTLFNRLMFLYFLQRKGWLAYQGDTDYLNALWRSHTPGEGTFYEGRLKLLFFTALNNPRSAEFDKVRALWEPLVGAVPFLNGGLFAQGPLDHRSGVVVPDAAIQLILRDLFARFNFTITESTPYDVEVAVDPEMLGKVFEELITGRHESGSYYTPRSVVAFMCREAIKGHLTAHVTGLSEAAASTFVDKHDVSAISVPLASTVLDALETITVVDPACGSGAYLLGMLHELVDLQRLLYNSAMIAGAKELYELKLRVIERNVYGVDIDPFAVNIAMLRLWLSLVVDYDGPGDPPALPNLDYKIALGDSLTAPSPHAVADLVRARASELAVELSRLKAAYLRATGEEKQQLEADITTRTAILRSLLLHSGVSPHAVDWRVQFAEVFERGGFDAVLANPPYVRQELIKEQKPALKAAYGDLYSGTADLYVYFYYRALELLAPGGMLVFISSNKWFRAGYGAKLREHIAKTCHVRSITDFGDLPVFESATAYPMIFTAQKGRTDGPSYFTQVVSLQPPYPDVRAIITAYGQPLPPGAIRGADWALTDASSVAYLDQMRKAGIPLGQYIQGQLYYGVKTGFNEAFVLDAATRAALIRADPKSTEIIKPLLLGRDIRKWRPNYQERWLIVTPIGVNIKRYPAIFAHLEQWQPELEKRWDKGNHWWELRSCDYYAAFDKPKIIYQEIATFQSFALELTGAFVNNKIFMIAGADLFLLGVLNSRAAWIFLNATCSKLVGGALAMQTPYLSTLPIPNASVPERSAIAALVQKCLDAKGQGPEVTAWEAEIDERVARLYGL